LLQLDGNLFIVYNMGSMDHPIGELDLKVNDQQYHVVRFIRNGPNSTLQVDNAQIQTKVPTGIPHPFY
jgi:leucine-rich repeat transmembrane neuronal protein 1/2